MNHIIREASSEDGAAIARICTTDLGYPCEAALTEMRLQELDPRREKVFVCEYNGIVIGFVHAEIYRLLYQDTLVNILGIAVSGSHRGIGAGRTLMDAVENWASEQNISRVRLNSGAGRTGAHEFYTHLGYENTKMQKRFLKTILP